MSTDYILNDNGGIELSLLEHSNKFDLEIYSEGLDISVTTNDLSIGDMKEIIQRMVNTVSYYDDDYTGCEVKY